MSSRVKCPKYPCGGSICGDLLCNPEPQGEKGDWSKRFVGIRTETLKGFYDEAFEDGRLQGREEVLEEVRRQIAETLQSGNYAGEPALLELLSKLTEDSNKGRAL